MYNKDVFRSIDEITLFDVGKSIITQGIVTFTGDIYPIILNGVYECPVCNKLYKMSEKDSKNFVCVCGMNLILSDEHTDFDDTMDIKLIDVSLDKKKNEITAVLTGSDAYFGKYKLGDIVSIRGHLNNYGSKNRIKYVINAKSAIIQKQFNLIINENKFLRKLKPKRKKSRTRGQEYEKWRNNVLERDEYKCRKCGNYDLSLSHLHAHHIRNFSENKNLRFEVDNGITFCKICHDTFHQTYGYKNNNRDQISDYLNYNY